MHEFSAVFLDDHSALQLIRAGPVIIDYLFLDLYFPPRVVRNLKGIVLAEIITCFADDCRGLDVFWSEESFQSLENCISLWKRPVNLVGMDASFIGDVPGKNLRETRRGFGGAGYNVYVDQRTFFGKCRQVWQFIGRQQPLDIVSLSPVPADNHDPLRNVRRTQNGGDRQNRQNQCSESRNKLPFTTSHENYP